MSTFLLKKEVPIASIAALKALSVTSLTNNIEINLLGYYAAGDGGGGRFYYDAGSATTDNGGTVIAPTVGAGRWLRIKSSEVHVAEWGAKGDGVTNDKAAIQAAIDYQASQGGGVVKLGAKTYIVNTGVVMAGNITLAGVGKFQSILKIGVSGQSLLYGFTAASMTVQDLTLWGYGDRAAGQESEIQLCYMTCSSGDLSFINVRGIYSRFFSLKGYASAGTTRAIGCEIKYSARDGMNFTGSLRAHIHDCDFDRVGDDAIAVHTSGAYEGVSDQFVQITNNRITMSLGIKVLGCQRGVISGNIMDRCVSYGIQFGIDGDEGETSHRDVIIANNVIKNTMRGSQWGYGNLSAGIYFVAPAARAGDVTLNAGGLPPGEFDDASNTWQPPEKAGSRYVGDLAPIARLSRLIVANNTVSQELPDGDYANLGFGNGWNSSGVANPLALTFLFNDHAIRIDNGLENCEFSNNILSGFVIGVCFTSTTSAAPRYRNTRFSNNRFTRMYRGYDVSSASGTTTLIGVVSESDWFDLDPYNTNAYREVSGSWLSTDVSLNICVLSNSTIGFMLMSPKIRNARAAAFASSGFVHVERPLYYAKPINSASGHKGCSELQGIENGGTLVEEDCDPTSATYGALVAVRNYSGLYASTIPTTGWYFAGAYVRKSNPSVDGNHMILRGWVRATNGTAHVAGTDWLLDYGSNVSPAT